MYRSYLNAALLVPYPLIIFSVRMTGGRYSGRTACLPRHSLTPSPQPHTHTHQPPPHPNCANWELPTSSSQEAIGCRDGVSTWRATGPSSLFSPSTYLSLFIPPSLPHSLPPTAFVADGELALPWRRSPSLSIIWFFFPPRLPSVFVRAHACFIYLFIYFGIFFFLSSCHCAAVH